MTEDSKVDAESDQTPTEAASCGQQSIHHQEESQETKQNPDSFPAPPAAAPLIPAVTRARPLFTEYSAKGSVYLKLGQTIITKDTSIADNTDQENKKKKEVCII